MNWIEINDALHLKNITDQSFALPQVIFKHSTRCSISSMAKSRLEKSNPIPGVDFHYLDLLAHRTISNLVASTFNIEHQSPQILVIRNGSCIYTESHSGIDMQDIAGAVGAG